MRKLSVPVLALFAAAMAAIVCSPKRDLFSDTVVRVGAAQTGGSALTSICARSSVDETGSNGAAM